MYAGAAAFLAGVLIFQFLPTAPDPVFAELLPLLLLLAVALPGPYRPVALLACGFAWSLFRADLVLQGRLPEALEGPEIVVEGTVASLPARDPTKLRFMFEPDKGWRGTERLSDLPSRLRLSWYGQAPPMVPGERWRLTVRLKRPHGFANPGGFDYERWLFQQGIGATGYVRVRGQNRRVADGSGHLVDRVRFSLVDALDQHLGGAAHGGLIKALAVGVRDGITDDQWAVMRTTGTNHLMAISGLHIGLVAGMAFFLATRLWSVPGHTVQWMAAPRLAALVAVLAAAGYAALAGFTVPTQRALVMVAVVMLGIYARRNLAAGYSLALALLLVLVLDPFSVLSVGFWLSFGAVAVILFGMTGRVSAQDLWWRWGRVQVLIAIGLLPLTLLFFQQHPLVGPLANLIAVPWTGLVVVPLVLLGTVLLPLPALAGPVLQASEWAIGALWWLLEGMAEWDLVYHGAHAPPWWAFVAGAVGVVLLLLPRGVPGRWLGAVWLLPLFLVPAERPVAGALWLTLLDVGQGLAAVVRTEDHVLVYDTGPRYGPSFDAGQAVLVPFLRNQGVTQIDRLMISHGDSDHAGGAASVLSALPVVTLMGTVPNDAGSSRGSLAGLPPATPCRRGAHWHWDGVDFHVLHPNPEQPLGENDDSCVLKIVAPGGVVLLTGDIERLGEAVLVREHAEQPDGLRADILAVPHHGSDTSSTPAFVDAVRPRYALFSVGYRNRFGLPDAEVLDRYRERGVVLLETAREGAVSFRLRPGTGIGEPRRHRRVARRVWHLGGGG